MDGRGGVRGGSDGNVSDSQPPRACLLSSTVGAGSTQPERAGISLSLPCPLRLLSSLFPTNIRRALEHLQLRVHCSAGYKIYQLEKRQRVKYFMTKVIKLALMKLFVGWTIRPGNMFQIKNYLKKKTVLQSKLTT